MFRKRTAEILRYSLKSLNELDIAKEAERLLIISKEPPIKSKNSFPSNPFKPGSYSIMDSAIVKAFSADFDPSNPFWSFLLGFSLISGTLGEASSRPIGSPLVPIYYFILSIPSTLSYTLAYCLPT